MMRSLARIRDALARLSGFLRRSKMEQRLAEEMQFHIEMQTEENMRAGMGPEEARRAAFVAFGGRERFREATRDEYRSRWLEELVRDVRYAVRGLRRAPTFTAAVVVSLAVGIGTMTAVFTVVERVVFRPLPYPDEARVVFLWSTSRVPGDARDVISYQDFHDWVSGSRTLERAAAFSLWWPTLTGVETPEALSGSEVSADFFRVLGVMPELGRTFRPDEDVVGGPDVVVISHSFWQRQFGGDPSVLGRVITLDGAAYTVIGVMPASFRDPEPLFNQGKAELWRPLDFNTHCCGRGARFLRAIARLRPGVTVADARAELNIVADRLAKVYPGTDGGLGVNVVPIHEQVVGHVRSVLLIVLVAAACVLLVMCGNVASLILARATTRSTELAVRAAIGASRRRLMRLLLIENVVLAVAGAACGLLLAVAGIGVLRAVTPPDLPRVNEIALDGRVFSFAVAIAALTALLVGFAPAFRASRAALGGVLRQASHGLSSRGRLRSAVVVVQFALSFVLLAGAGLLTQSLLRLNSVPLGFDPHNVLTMRVSVSGKAYASEAQHAAFFRTLATRLEAIPGVREAGSVSSLALEGTNDVAGGVDIPGRIKANEHDSPMVHYRAATPDFRRALGVPLIRGRDFTKADSSGAPQVALLNRTAAAKLFPGMNPIGKRVNVDIMQHLSCEIIGIIGDVRIEGPATEAPPEMIVPFAQAPWNSAAVVIRTAGDPGAIEQAVRNVVRSIDANAPISAMRSMSALAAAQSARQRFYALLFGCFAGLALVLSAVGIYGVIAYVVAERRHEIGIRMALGAGSRHVLSALIGRAALLIAVGLVLGTMGALAGTRVLTALLYGVQPGDVQTMAASAALLALVALAAAFVPALRATRIAPAEAFRSE
ncbi:MAG TPA: ABC transporter permease [Gemmatimonadaceae bacterium]|nr:ABC transporter permease [Gemmatimonadaceae bacterium]